MTRHSRRTAIALVVLGCLAAAIAIGTIVHAEGSPRSPSAEGPLVYPDGADAGVSELPADRYEQVVIGAMLVCLREAGEVHVTGVRPADGALTVEGFRLRPNPFLNGGEMIGDAPGDFASLQVGATTDPLTTQCSAGRGAGYELLVQVRRGSESTASSGFVISYEADGRTFELTWPYKVIMCLDPTDDLCELSRQEED